jgi:2-C-methyl-D-erythritol 4-phosphate cytidylyltransferase/2-C-methyl-D-erythritol 2,4-cyclodiphosphate synthase
MAVVAIIVAAGRGARAGGGLPKQYRSLGALPVLARTLQAFMNHPRIDRVQPVVNWDDLDLYQDALRTLQNGASKLCDPVAGGATRQVSVRLGLEATASGLASTNNVCVLVHDAARPFVGSALIDRAVDAGRDHGAAVPGLPVTDTIKVVDRQGQVVDTPQRETLRAIQTPQAFALESILDAHRKAAELGLDGFTDDGALAEWAGLAVTVFVGDPANIKLTRAADFDEAERRLGTTPMSMVTRAGTGFDVHAFGDGDHVWLGGIRIAHNRGILAHSDGDVVLHALTDALLGALCDGDIGVHFPPSDPQWRGASSDRFLAFAAERVRASGGVIDHLDVTVLCEWPRIGPYRDAIRERIAAVATVPLGSVSIKATTTERLGFTGRGEGLAAQAMATIRLPIGEA